MHTIADDIDERRKGGSHATMMGLLRAFDAAEVSAVAWKGTDRLERALSGEGDLDLLVAGRDWQRASEILAERGFRRIESAWWKTQASIDDWFGVERVSGRLLHVQLYRRLVLGSAYSAQIEVPGSDRIFASAVGGIPRGAAPAEAAVLRACRAALAGGFAPGRNRISLLAEAREIASGLDEGELAGAAGGLFDTATGALIELALSDGKLRDLRRHLQKSYKLADQGGATPLTACLFAAAAKLNRKTLQLPILNRRKLGKKAPVVALIGSDGSGKSTISNSMARELGKKIDVRHVYLGTGSGSVSLLRLPLVWLRKARSRSGGSRGDTGPAPTETGKAPGWARALWGITVALERRAKMRRAKRASSAGVIVVTDRYPQTGFPGIHDGPRLSQWLTVRTGLRRLIAEWERRIYRRLAASPPDLVLLLDVTLELASARRPEESVQELSRRIDVARSLQFGERRRITLDAAQPQNSVAAQALGEVIHELEL